MFNLTNHFLVAMPTQQQSDIFENSVVYVTDYSVYTGAVGVIINKPIGTTDKYTFHNLNLASYNPEWLKCNLYFGGPVSTNNGFVLHHTFNGPVDKPLDLTGSRHILDEIAISQYRDDLFIAMGYAVWGRSQIEQEVKREDWLVVKADTDLIFAVTPELRYMEALKLLGISNNSCLYMGREVHC